MPDESFDDKPTPEDASPEIDPTQLALALRRLRAEQNLFGGGLAGFATSLLGAAIWAVITVTTGYQIGFMAVGVGLLVGLTVRALGKGIDTIFGIAGAVLALFGCLLGNLLAVVGLVAKHQGVPFFDALSALEATTIPGLMGSTFSPVDLLFYGIAVYEGYKLSFRQIRPEELQGFA